MSMQSKQPIVEKPTPEEEIGFLREKVRDLERSLTIAESKFCDPGTHLRVCTHTEEEFFPFRYGVVCNRPRPRDESDSALDVVRSFQFYGGFLVCESCDNEDAKRIAAALNFVRGVSTEFLEEHRLNKLLGSSPSPNDDVEEVSGESGRTTKSK